MSINKFTIQKSFAISAGAGSGKTYTLSRRFINILLGFDFFIEEAGQGQLFDERHERKADLEQIVTITYTEAAALEMKDRIFELINKICSFSTLNTKDGDYHSIDMAFDECDDVTYVQERLNKAQQEIAEANITTIHGFCLNILKRHSDVAKVDGNLEVLNDDNKNRIFNEVYFKVINSYVYRDDILDVTRHVSLYKSQALIKQYVFSHQFRASFDHYVHGHGDAIKALLVSTFLEPLEEEIASALEELENDQRYEAFEQFVSSFYSFSAQKFTPFAEALGVPKSLGVKKFPISDSVKKKLEKLVSYFCEVDATQEARFVEIIERFRRILQAIKESYDAALAEVNGTDFDTIIQEAAKIISKVETDYRYIMVDEFQDTNAIQWEIVKAASKNQANLFVVGDEKQSIYAFQGGEIEVFHNAIREQFKGEPVEMRDNYRSDQKVIGFVNTLFNAIFEKSEIPPSKSRQIVNDFEARAQSLNSKSKEEGSVAFLVSKIDDEESEAENLAQFIKSIVAGERYEDLTQLIKEKKKSIAVLYDAKSKMLLLKEALLRLGVECKVSASENYYHAIEISDIFFVLKSLSILRKKVSMLELSSVEKFFVTGAMRSSIMHLKESEIYLALQEEGVYSWFLPWIEKAAILPIHTLVRSLLSQSGAYAAYALMENYEQRLANIDKFVMELIAFEGSLGYDLDALVHQLEQSIYHSEVEEDEAFYRSSTGGSIELCSIHSTKGLAYPMVIMADAAKRLTSQVSSESIKFNTLKDTKERRYNLIGFKVETYEPLSLRILKEIDKRKHMAEKKRLYYVALTRPENHLLISANLKATNSGVSSIVDSYLEMSLKALHLSEEQLFDGDDLPSDYGFIYKDNLKEYPQEQISKTFTDVKSLTPLRFKRQERRSATAEAPSKVVKKDAALQQAALRGTLVHKALEHFWDALESEAHFEQLFLREGIVDETLKSEVKRRARHFRETPIYQQLLAGAEHVFEFGFDEVIDGTLHRGSVDLIIKDVQSDGWVIVDFKSGEARVSEAYAEQLAFYKRVMEHKGLKINDTQLCWLG